MAGIRGVQNPMPTKKPTSGRSFKQMSGYGPSGKHSDVQAAAMASDRKGPPSGRNSRTQAGSSHMTNAGLKRGTSDR